MKTYLIILLIFLVSCNAKVDKVLKEENDINTNTAESNKVSETLFSDSEIKQKEYSNIQAKLEYLENNGFNLVLRLEHKDPIIFETENQNVYLETNVVLLGEVGTGIDYHKDNLEKLIKIPLEDNKIPHIFEISLDQNTNYLDENSKNIILEKKEDFFLSVNVRDPQGYILEVSNTIFEVNN